MKIVTIVGARPQFIKAYPLSKEIRKKHEEIMVHTGQHYDYNMSKTFFDEMGIPEPDYNLGVTSDLGKMIKEIERVLIKEKPSAVIVFGDTFSTLAGTLAANKNEIKVIHIESGLRSFDKSMPEEINRIVVDHSSEIFFCPTEIAVKNLKDEGITENIFHTGDVMYDSILHFENISKTNVLERLEIKPKEYFLATVHRQSNTDIKENLKEILEGFKDSGEKIIFPVHPRTKKYLKEYGFNYENSNIIFVEPVSYLEMIALEKNAKKILTDSGGIQKEAFFLGVPCITLRENTEWTETIENGWNVLVGTDKTKIVDAIKNFNPTEERKNYYGDGKASKKIIEIIEKLL